MAIEFIGKCLLINENNENVLVIGDIHLGFMNEKVHGIDIEGKIFDEMIEEFDCVFGKVGEVDKIILLGDLKHSFSSLSREERNGLVNLLDYLAKKGREIIVIRGNHDNYLLNITSKRKMKVKDYFLWKKYCFLHGDRDFKEIYDERVKVWVMGHLHPAIDLKENGKKERYKCFLEGEYKKRKVIILPSFFDFNEGINMSELIGENRLVWNFDLKKFSVRVIGDKLEVLDFGKLRRLGNG